MKQIKLILFILSSIFSIAQTGYEKDIEIAEIFYSRSEYNKATEFYTRAYTRKKTHETSLMLARCHKELGNYPTAKKWYKQTLKQDVSEDLRLEYVEILLFTENYNLAKKQLLLVPQEDTSNFKRAQQLNASCDSALLWKSNLNSPLPKNCHDINTEFSEITPAFYKKGLLFASNRELTSFSKIDHSNGTNYYSLFGADISQKGWNKPKKISFELNSSNHEIAPFYDTLLNELYFVKNESVRLKKSDQGLMRLKLYKSNDKNKWAKPSLFILNDSSSNFSHPHLSKDGNLFFFSSDMEGGYGGYDIYVCVRKDSLWTNPVNLGSEINTPKDEISPFLSSKNHLFFSSNGHLGMGGFDIFQANLTKEGFRNITNLKYPINSSQNDMSFIYSSDKKTAYLSSNRFKGHGMYDLYTLPYE